MSRCAACQPWTQAADRPGAPGGRHRREDTGGGIRPRAAVVRAEPADAKAVTIEIAIGEMAGEGGVHLALLGVIALLDDGAVWPQHLAATRPASCQHGVA